MRKYFNFLGMIIIVLVSLPAKGQFNPFSREKINNLHREVVFIEEFNNSDVLFKKPIKIGSSAHLTINDGKGTINFKKKGDGLILVSKSKKGNLDIEAVEFEMKFKMNSADKNLIGKDRYWIFNFYIGQKNRKKSPLRVVFEKNKYHCFQETPLGFVRFSGSLNGLFRTNSSNLLKIVRIKDSVLLFLNGTIIGQSGYNKKKDNNTGKAYHYNADISNDNEDLRIKFIQTNVSIDYIKVSELTDKKKAPKFIEERIVQVTDQAQTTSYKSLKPKGDFYAIIIGNNEYLDSEISTLDQPILDATKLYNILTTKYTFEKDNVIFLKNATRSTTIDAFDEISSKLNSEDNLLIFYAGHGYWNEEKGTGYWLPIDAKKGKTSNWLRNSTIQGYLDEIPAKHTLLIADACFGGGIFKTRKAFNDAPNAIENLYKLKSRKGITSGMLNEVPDRSVFMKYLTKRLEENNIKYISSLELFTQFRVAVMNNSNNTPQYGTIHNTGDEGGDFIFIKKTHPD